jgi:hypothetical protein
MRLILLAILVSPLSFTLAVAARGLLSPIGRRTEDGNRPPSHGASPTALFRTRTLRNAGLFATIFGTLCLVSMPAFALISLGESPSILTRVNFPQWPMHSSINPRYRGVPEIALLSNMRLPPQPRTLALLLPLPGPASVMPAISPPSAQLPLPPKAAAPKAKQANSASSRRSSPRKAFFARLKSAAPTLTRMFMGLY